MRPARLLVAAAILSSLAGLALAGDPVPDVDVTVEQNPGASVFIEVPNGAPFDRFTLKGPKDFIAGLQPDRLPSGWAMSREGKEVVLSGPAVSGPTRLTLRAARTLDKSVDWDVSIAGRTLASRKNVVPRSVPQRVVRNTLQGVVVMPEKVSPGEAIALRPLPGSNLPPGRFVLSGVVTEPLTEEELATARKTGDKQQKPVLDFVKGRHAGFALAAPAGTSCRDLLPLGAALVVAGSTDGCATCKSFYESRSNTANRAPTAVVVPASGATTTAPTSSWTVNELRARHDVAMNSIRNIKALAAVEPAGFTIDEKGVKVWDLTSAGASLARMMVGQRPPEGKPEKPRFVALEITATDSGCLFTPREPDLYDLAVAKKAGPLPGNGKDNVETRTHVGQVPEDLLPGTSLALQYLDVFGDAVLDVPVVSDTQIVPPPAPSENPAPPCVTAATAYAQAEDTVCVCGNFPTLAAQTGLWVDERDAGTPVSLSTRTLQYQLPRHALTPGRHVWSGNPEAGFASSCRAHTQVIHIGGEIDSHRLLSGESTPMRLTVSGTTDKVPVLIKNLTPGIIRIEGGEVQTVESSGGSPNLVTRSVQGLVRGAFNVEWSLAVDRCPCE